MVNGTFPFVCSNCRREYDIDSEVDITKNLILVKKYLAQYKGDALHYPLRGKDKTCLEPNGERDFSIRLLKLQTDPGSDATEPCQYFITNLLNPVSTSSPTFQNPNFPKKTFGICTNPDGLLRQAFWS